MFPRFGISLGKRVIISLDSEFEDSPRPDTKEPRCWLDSRSSVADSTEASTGMLTQKPNS